MANTEVTFPSLASFQALRSGSLLLQLYHNSVRSDMLLSMQRSMIHFEFPFGQILGYKSPIHQKLREVGIEAITNKKSHYVR